ncbi:MAG: protein kinase [Lachnospiraceae bacterium]|nr:protein kinase [Lachnospiraceae bacterium]
MQDYKPELRENTILNGRYRIIKTLGMGGFGITYKAYDNFENMECAIKELFPKDLVMRLEDGQTVIPISASKVPLVEHGKERFLEEAGILKKLNNVASVVSVYNYFEANGTSYFVMEYLKGANLSVFARNNGGTIPYQVVSEIIKSVGEALIKVHSMNIFHRDLSPDNIFITMDGEVKLIDFGNAKSLIRDSGEALSVVLKPGFAPIEQYSKNGKQGTYTDVYSLAGTIYYVLVGQKIPEAFDRLNGIAYKKLEEFGFEKYISDAIDNALKINYKERTQTVEDFLKDLRLDGEYVEPPKPPKSEPIITEPPKPLPKSQKLIPQIHVLTGKQRGKSYNIPVDLNVPIGKSPSVSQIIFDDDTYISRKHCELFFDSISKSFYILDCSTNGTWVNGNLIDRGVIYMLNIGDIVMIGNRNCAFKVGVVNG